jgi:Cu(I)/Ag(I) efflux system membrane fusion protein
VEQAEGVYDAREIRVGNRVGSYYPVVEGLREGDRVAAEGAFLIDAESRLNPSASALYSAQYSKSQDETLRAATEHSSSEKSQSRGSTHHH